MKHIRLKLILLYNATLAFCALILYYIIPILLNYGPGTINTDFDKRMSGGLLYYQQIILVTLIIAALVTVVLSIALRKINNYSFYKKKYEETKEKKYEVALRRIRTTCFSFPNYVFIAFITIPIMLEFLLLLGQTYTSSSDFKLVLIIFILTTIAVSIDNIYAKKVFSKVLIDLDNIELPNKRRKAYNKVTFTNNSYNSNWYSLYIFGSFFSLRAK